jgi:type IV pilus assembly protein PilM
VGDKKVIGIDLGREALKYVVITVQKNTVAVEASGVRTLDLPNDADNAAWRAAAVRTLKDWAAEKKLPTSTVVVTAPSAHTLLRALKVPTATLDKQLAEEAKQQLPFPLEELDWSATTVATEGDQSHVSLAAIKKDINADLLALLAEAGLQAAAVESGALAIGNVVLHAAKGAVTPATAVLSLGATASNLTILDGAKLWMRTLPVTGAAIISALAKTLNVSEAQARDTLFTGINLAVQQEGESDATKNARAAITRLIMEITRSLTFYKSQLNGDKPQKLLLTGGYATIPGLREFLAERLKIEVEPLAVFAATRGVGADAQAHLLGEALGCALTGAGLTPYSLNLLPTDIQAQRQFDRKKPLLIAAAALLALVFLGLFVSTTMKKSTAQQRLLAAQEQLATAERYDADIGKIRRQLDVQFKETENLRRVLWERDLFVQLWQAAEKVMPTNAWVNGVETKTFGEIYEKERAGLPVNSPERSMTVEDEDALARVVRVVVRGGCYGKWEDIEAAFRAVPGVSHVSQAELTQWKKYIDYALDADLDWDGNGTNDYLDTKQAYSVQARSR